MQEGEQDAGKQGLSAASCSLAATIMNPDIFGDPSVHEGPE